MVKSDSADQQAGRRRRRYDPDRRARIAESALAVVAEAGFEGLTHRAVAAAADVPVGSTTYHFADKDELLLAAVEHAEARGREINRQVFLDHGPSDDLAGAVAALVDYLTVVDRDQLTVDYEIFLAARRRPAVRPSAARWVEDFYEMVAPFTDPLSARVLTDLVEGLLVQAIVFGRALSADEARPLIARALDGP